MGYYLDGVRVPYIFHVGAGPSVVNPAIVERVDLYSGGYPAQYGRYAGAIVSAETTAPRDDFHGEGNLRIFDVGAMVESGFAGGRGTALVGGRYSYTGALFSLISPNTILDYRDYQLRITYDLTPRDRIGLFAFGAYDLLAEKENGIASIVFGSEFYRFDLRYDHKLDGDGHLRWATTGGFDQTRLAGGQQNARAIPFGTRLELTQPLSPDFTLRAGLDAQFDRYDADPLRWGDPDDPDTTNFNAVFPLRFDALAEADADGDHAITLEELARVPGPAPEPDAGLVSGDGGGPTRADVLYRSLVPRMVRLGDSGACVAEERERMGR